MITVVLCGVETCFLTMKADCEMRLLDIKVLRKICQPRRDETTRVGDNYTDLCLAHDFIKIMKWRELT
jgi:hypothetical protein